MASESQSDSSKSDKTMITLFTGGIQKHFTFWFANKEIFLPACCKVFYRSTECEV